MPARTEPEPRHEPAGIVTVGIGSNTWAGGDNSVNFGWTGHLADATVTIDGETVVEGGSLKVGSVATGD